MKPREPKSIEKMLFRRFDLQSSLWWIPSFQINLGSLSLWRHYLTDEPFGAILGGILGYFFMFQLLPCKLVSLHCWKDQLWQMISDSSVQIGSYFGSVLQTVDVDGDSYTDILLVGSPMYMGTERNEQGQVYVYKLNQVWLKMLSFESLLRAEIHTEIAMVQPLIADSPCSSLGWPVWARVHFKACQSVLLYCPLRQLHQ